MTYSKSLLSIIVSVALMGSSVDARIIKRSRKRRTPIKKKMLLKKQSRKASPTQSVKTVTEEPSKWFTLGQTLGKQVAEYSVDQVPDSVNELPLGKNEEYINLSAAVTSGTPGTEESTKNFADLQEFYRGHKQGLSTFVPFKGNDRTPRRKNLIVKLTQIMTNCFIEAKDTAEVNKVMQEKMKELQEEFIAVTAPNDLGFAWGQSHGHQACRFIATQAAGKEVTDEAKNTYKQDVEKFFAYLKKYTPEEKNEALHNYFRGIEAVLSQFPLDEVLKNTPQETADSLRKEHQAALKNAQEGLASIDGEAKNESHS